MMEFYSHIRKDEMGNVVYRKFLIDHLNEVSERMESNIYNLYHDKTMRNIGKIIGLGHDFGKYMVNFQNYLLYGTTKNDLYQHGFISSLFAAFNVRMLLKEAGERYRYFPLISYFVVLHHHGDLISIKEDIVSSDDIMSENFEDVSPARMRNKLILLEQQRNDIKQNISDIEKEYNNLYKSIYIKEFLNDYLSIFSELEKEYDSLEKENSEYRNSLFEKIYVFYSSLIDNDKRDAGNVGNIDRHEINDNIVEIYKNDNLHEQSALNNLREKIYETVNLNIEKVDLDKHILTITAPTGSGKTITSISAALKLRNRLEKEKNVKPRIIYALPYTSIIDQNFDVINDILLNIDDFKSNAGSYIIKHHHLSEITYEYMNEKMPIDESLQLVESWESEIIVTTFIQLLNTLFGYQNKFLKKYHNLANSIILLDEVQNIKVEYWPAVNKVLKLICKYLNCYIILLTATRPLIFEDNDFTELLTNNELVFKKLDRVRIVVDMNEITLNGLCDKFVQNYDKDKSYLVVLNTIKCSIDFYNNISERIPDAKLFYLSTNIVPKERAKRINRIKKLQKINVKVIVISTQVVEAGVDIDMDEVIRDLAPLDSIIQVAGRCNRNAKNDKGIVRVYNIKDKKSYATMVYGSISITIVKDILKDVDEVDFYDLINLYFAKIKEKISDDESKDIIDAIDNFRYDRGEEKISCISDFNLIPENNYIDTYIQVDDLSVCLWNYYMRNVANEKDFVKRKNNYLRIRKYFKQYIVSMPQKYAKSMILPKKNSTIMLLPKENLDLYYNQNTGFTRNIDDITLIF